MPFIETIFFKDDKKKLKKINKLISLKISKIFDTQGNTITIFNNFIEKKILIIILSTEVLKKEFLLKFQD